MEGWKFGCWFFFRDPCFLAIFFAILKKHKRKRNKMGPEKNDGLGRRAFPKKTFPFEMVPFFQEKLPFMFGEFIPLFSYQGTIRATLALDQSNKKHSCNSQICWVNYSNHFLVSTIKLVDFSIAMLLHWGKGILSHFQKTSLKFFKSSL